MKKIIRIILLGLMCLTLLSGCSRNSNQVDEETQDDKTTIILGVRADGIDMAEAIRGDVEAAGYELEVITFDDSIQPNVALGEGSIDVNWFQHKPYLDSYNSSNGTDFVMADQYTHYPIFAMYSEKYDSVEEIPDGAKIGLCNDRANQTRGLIMLQDLGLIKLAESVDEPTIYDIVENLHAFEFIEAEMSVLPRSLPDLDAIVLAGQHMNNAGFEASSYIAESKDGPDYPLGFVTRKENADVQWLKDLVECARNESLRRYYEEEGSLIPFF
ncbi:MAG: metal ABC transporter substrate-binding protein [Bacteroidales bacterium]|nr:metal ABC transporter substrate-binding protein [Bacteroidales bacterium]